MLRSLPYHPASQRNERFRNPDGVAFKLQNLRKVATGKGLGNVSKTDRVIWAELGNEPARVAEICRLINASLRAPEWLVDTPEDEEEFFEGRILTQLHKKKERNPNIRKKLLAARRKRGSLICEMCLRESESDDFTLQDAIFEAHHLLPMATAAERQTRLRDMALLCANCHRLLHRAISLNKRWLTIEECRRLTYSVIQTHKV